MSIAAEMRLGVGIAIISFWPLLLIGCGAVDVLDINAELGTGVTAGARSRVTEDESNDTLGTSSSLNMAPGQPLSIGGSIQTAGDIDVYDIGPLHAGDRLMVDVDADGRLDAAAAVFDADGNLLYLNDDRNYFARLVDPYLDFTVRRDSDSCYVAVATSPASRSTGDYTASVSPTLDTRLPLPRPQTVLLNFDGASSVAFGGRQPVEIAPFESGKIAPDLEGANAELIDYILTRVREDYLGLDVEFYTSRDDITLPEDVTTIHFGAHDPALLGVAESVDEFNESSVQEAIVFTDTFEVFSALNPTIEEYATALANVASHETGHLLGLIHTTDTRGIMDITATLRQLMENQAFSRSPIEPTTFPFGHQDAALLLVESVGGDLEVVRENAETQLVLAKRAHARKGVGLWDAPRVPFSTCGSVTRGARLGKYIAAGD